MEWISSWHPFRHGFKRLENHQVSGNGWRDPKLHTLEFLRDFFVSAVTRHLFFATRCVTGAIRRCARKAGSNLVMKHRMWSTIGGTRRWGQTEGTGLNFFFLYMGVVPKPMSCFHTTNAFEHFVTCHVFFGYCASKV